nr:TetR/AcrR family transcriptional regulator C-terminal domain-containing protein [uncultured Oscillibacter sp.]
MSAEIREDRTKHGLEIALQEMLKRKPLDQIRVRELTELCDIRRQSFYYHFSDVYALFDWSLQRERARLLRRQENCLTWQQALRDLLAYIGERQSYYQALLQSRGRAGLREVVEDAVAQLLEKTMDYYRRRCGAPEDQEAEQTRLACWETIFLALVEGWVWDDLFQTPEELASLLESSVKREVVGATWLYSPQWKARN